MSLENKKNVLCGILLACIIVIGGLFRYASFPVVSLSSDEYWSITRATSSPIDVILNSDLKYNPPIHEVVIRATIEVWNSMLAVKIVFIILGLLLIPATFFAAKKWFGFTSAFATSLLVAVNPQYIIAGTEIRGYGLSWLFLMVALYYYHDVVSKDSRYVPFILLSSLAVYSHYIAGLIFFCQSVYLVPTLMRRGKLVHYVTAAAITLPAFGFIIYGSTIRNVNHISNGKPQPLMQTITFIFEFFSKSVSSFKLVAMLSLIAVIIINDRRSRQFISVYLLAMTSLLIAGVFFTLRPVYGMFFPVYFWMAIFGAKLLHKNIYFKAVFLLFFLFLSVNCISTFSTHLKKLALMNAEATQTVSILKNLNIGKVYTYPEYTQIHLLGACVNDIPLHSMHIMQLKRKSRDKIYLSNCPLTFFFLRQTRSFPTACYKDTLPFSIVSFSDTKKWEVYSQNTFCHQIINGNYFKSYYCDPCKLESEKIE